MSPFTSTNDRREGPRLYTFWDRCLGVLGAVIRWLGVGR